MHPKDFGQNAIKIQEKSVEFNNFGAQYKSELFMRKYKQKLCVFMEDKNTNSYDL